MIKKFQILSIFTGGGGLDIGFHGGFNFLNKKYTELPFETHTAIDFNKDACKTIAHNKQYFKNTNVFHADITKLNESELETPAGGFDILLGGFPCLAFSTQGKRLGIKDDLSGKLYLRYFDFLNFFRPKVFVAENVKGIISANGGEALKIITKKFESAGYLVSVHLVNFAEYGTPQLRERVLFIGVRNDLNYSFELPDKVCKDNTEYITSKMAFEGLSDDLPNSVGSKLQSLTRDRIDAIPEGGNFKDLPPHLSIKAKMSNVYRRLDRNKASYTVTASGGGGSMHYHYEEPRPLTNRERARLQGFPDDLHFQGSLGEVRRQIGNAVPPVGVYPFAEQLSKLLLKINSK